MPQHQLFRYAADGNRVCSGGPEAGSAENWIVAAMPAPEMEIFYNGGCIGTISSRQMYTAAGVICFITTLILLSVKRKKDRRNRFSKENDEVSQLFR